MPVNPPYNFYWGGFFHFPIAFFVALLYIISVIVMMTFIPAKSVVLFCDYAGC